MNFQKKKKNRYCCSHFASLHLHPDTADCIRIIKFPRFPAQLIQIEYYVEDNQVKVDYIKNSDVPYRFFNMAPTHPLELKDRFNKGIKGEMFSFCPFCGVNLYTFYVIERKIDDYVNEIEGETF